MRKVIFGAVATGLFIGHYLNDVDLKNGWEVAGNLLFVISIALVALPKGGRK